MIIFVQNGLIIWRLADDDLSYREPRMQCAPPTKYDTIQLCLLLNRHQRRSTRPQELCSSSIISQEAWLANTIIRMIMATSTAIRMSI